MLMVRHVFPDFASELRDLALASDRPDLAAQVLELALVDRCRCDQDDCAQFYTAPRPLGAYDPGHSNVPLGGPGIIVLDVAADRVVGVAVLGRGDVKQRLDAVWPLQFAEASWREIDAAMLLFLGGDARGDFSPLVRPEQRSATSDGARAQVLEPILRFLLDEIGRHDADWSTETLEVAVPKARAQLLARRPELSAATVEAMVSHYAHASK